MSQQAQAVVQAQPKTPVVSSLKGGILQRKCDCGQHTLAGGECEECRKKKQGELPLKGFSSKEPSTLQRAAISSAPAPASAVPPVVHNVLHSPGQPLDRGTRSFMESRFGHDFSQVRVHTDPQSAESASAVNARAYTVGQHVVFGAGQYAPETTTGKHLLAHELTHTIQQQGLQRYASDGLLSVSTHDGALEREAEMAASAVTGHGIHAPLTPIASRPLTPVISRAKKRELTVEEEEEKSAPTKRGEVEKKPLPGKATVGQGQRVLDSARRSKETVAFTIDEFVLPDAKRPVKTNYDARASAGALEATMDVTGDRPTPSLKQESAVTDQKRVNWLTKVGWPTGNDPQSEKEREGLWYEAGGDQGDFPRVAKKTCDLDHIIELQIGGSNAPENFQVLDPTPNRESGAEIRGQLSGLATEIHDQLAPDAIEIILHFNKVRGEEVATCAPDPSKRKGKASTCTDVECNAKDVLQAKGGKGGAAKATQPYLITAGGLDATLEVNPPPQTETDLSGPENKGAAELIPGIILEKLTRAKSKDGVDARIESQIYQKSSKKTRLPIAIRPPQDALQFHVEQKEGKGHLRLATRKEHVTFTYPYLSEGSLSLTFDEKSGLAGHGTLTPSLPLLKHAQIKVTLEQETFSGSLDIPPEKIHLPIPGFEVKESTLGLILAPEFKATGAFGFRVGSLVDGSLTASADTDGFVAKGEINAHLPGVDKANGRLEYRQRRWSGGIEIASTQIKIPGVESGVLRVTLTDDGLVPSGEIALKLGEQRATLGIQRRGQNWIYTGRGKFAIPGLKPVDVELMYDEKQLSGHAETDFEIKGLRGKLRVKYLDGKITGLGRLDVKRGRAQGFIEVRMSDAYKFSGKGNIEYQFSENLIGQLGVELFENEDVRVVGGVKFPKPILLFKGFSDKFEFFKYSVDIPIFAIPLGPKSIGLVAIISGALGASYGIGPGELINVSVLTAFNPLSEQTNFELAADAMLVIPAHAGVSLTISGALGVDVAGLATVSGGLSATGTADLQGGFRAGVHVIYAQGKFALDADAEIRAALKLLLGIDAYVELEAGILGLKYEKKKVWNLAAYALDTGLEFGLKAPLHYASDEPFHAPSFSDITWTKPNIDVKELLPRLIRQARGEDK